MIKALNSIDDLTDFNAQILARQFDITLDDLRDAFFFRKGERPSIQELISLAVLNYELAASQSIKIGLAIMISEKSYLYHLTTAQSIESYVLNAIMD